MSSKQNFPVPNVSFMDFKGAKSKLNNMLVWNIHTDILLNKSEVEIQETSFQSLVQ